jgi:hypothetical protein
MKRILKWTLIGFASLLVGGAGALIHAEPAMGMYLCPSCYGFETVRPHLYADRTMGAGAITTFEANLADGRARAADFYDSMRTDPDVFVCGSEACDTRMGFRGAKARAYGSSFVLAYAQGHGVEFLAHELSHIELHRRIGLWRGLGGAIPAWFDEGLAAVISRDSRYVAVRPDGEPACLAEPDGALPTDRRAWGKAAGKKDRPLYAMAACSVIRWMRENAGRPGGLDAIDRVAAGGAFSTSRAGD